MQDRVQRKFKCAFAFSNARHLLSSDRICVLFRSRDSAALARFLSNLFRFLTSGSCVLCSSLLFSSKSSKLRRISNSASSASPDASASSKGSSSSENSNEATSSSVRPPRASSSASAVGERTMGDAIVGDIARARGARKRSDLMEPQHASCIVPRLRPVLAEDSGVV
eukprot:jgi/Pico_ML_1/52739/g3403.t1